MGGGRIRDATRCCCCSVPPGGAEPPCALPDAGSGRSHRRELGPRSRQPRTTAGSRRGGEWRREGGLGRGRVGRGGEGRRLEGERMVEDGGLEGYERIRVLSSFGLTVKGYN